MKRSTELRLRAWILVGAYVALIFGVSSIPQGPLHVPVFKLSDKVAHLAEYAGFGLLLAMALSGTLRRRGGAAWLLVGIVVLGGAVVGALDERYQLTVPGREAELLDWVADVVGALIGAGLAVGLASWLSRKRSRAGESGIGRNGDESAPARSGDRDVNSERQVT